MREEGVYCCRDGGYGVRPVPRCGGMSTIRRIVGVSFIAVWNFLLMRDWVASSSDMGGGRVMLR